MASDLFFPGNDHRKPQPPKAPWGTQIEIKFGATAASLPCSSCQKFECRGFWVIIGQKAMLICVKCTARALHGLQKMYPTEKLIDVDVNVDEEEMSRATRAVQDIRPELSDSEAAEICKAAFDAL